jgi:hypothetical protein
MDDVIDVRDVIERFEELEKEHLAHPSEHVEFKQLKELLDDLKSYGGDEQWRGDWYPLTLVRDSHFKNYAQELAEDCCPFSRNSPEMKALEMWPYRCIDWEQAARELKMDYSIINFDGVDYWYR